MKFLFERRTENPRIVAFFNEIQGESKIETSGVGYCTDALTQTREGLGGRNDRIERVGSR